MISQRKNPYCDLLRCKDKINLLKQALWIKKFSVLILVLPQLAGL